MIQYGVVIMKADVFVSRNRDEYNVKVQGRATFQCSPPLRNLAKNMRKESVGKIFVNLAGCTGMDSTFMGVLAMLGLEARGASAEMCIVGANHDNRDLLDGLGVSKLFSFMDESVGDVNDDATPENAEFSMLENAKTVLDAHKVLIDVDEANKEKFDKVVELAGEDVDRLAGKK